MPQVKELKKRKLKAARAVAKTLRAGATQQTFRSVVPAPILFPEES
jgi:hypothetical protein